MDDMRAELGEVRSRGAAPADTERLRLAATAFLRTRPLVLGPFFAATAAVLALSGAPKERLAPLGVGASLLLGVFFVERARAAKGPVTPADLARSLALTVLGIGGAMSLTGGLVSPLVPMLFAPLGIGFAAFGPSREERRLLVMLALVVLCSGLVTAFVPDLALPRHTAAPVLGLAVAASALLLRVGVSGLTGAHVRAVHDRDAAMSALAAASAARTKELELVGSRLAHEVKNPLTAVRALAEGMAERARAKGQGSSRDAERLEVVLAEVSRIQEIVEGYAALARPLESVDARPCDLGAVLTAVVATLEGRATRAGVTVGLTLPDEASRTFTVDPRRVHEAAQNLVQNALEASPRGAHVEVTLTHGPEPVVTVCDRGHGVASEIRAHLGDPFVTNKTGGTGLGLAHARRVAELHGGTLEVLPREGGGTRAVLRLGPGVTKGEA
jgi:signal transduction histidine kinase